MKITKLYFYQIGYFTEEESGRLQLSHQKKFGPVTFERMVRQAALAAAQSYLDQQNKRLKESLTCPILRALHEIETEETKACSDYVKALRSEHHVTFADIYKQTAQNMCDLFGFQKIEYEQTYSIFGWTNLTTDSTQSWKYHLRKESTFRRMAEDLNTKLIFPTLDLEPMAEETKRLLQQFDNKEIDHHDLWSLQQTREKERQEYEYAT